MLNLKSLAKASLLGLIIALIMLVLTAGLVGVFAYQKIKNLALEAGTSITEIKQLVDAGIARTPTLDNNKKNFLVLGLDSLETRPDSQPLTDSMMILSLDTKNAKLSALSLPRDLWHTEYQTRINALYFYGTERNKENPTEFPQQVISEMTGIPIHHTITISMDSLKELIDILGGIKVDVKESFVDNEFPRSDVDVTKVKDPKLLYETVSFEKGLQYMNGETALKFVRSRKSASDQGTDNARAERQQLVINSIIQRVKNFNIKQDYKIIPKLYVFYKNNYQNSLPIEELIATLNVMKNNNIELNNLGLNMQHLSIYPEDKMGVITNPPIHKYKNQWVYEIRNQEEFKNEIKNKLAY